MNLTEKQLNTVLKKVENNNNKEIIIKDLESVILAKPKRYVLVLGVFGLIYFLFLGYFYLQTILNSELIKSTLIVITLGIFILFPFIVLILSLYAILKWLNEYIIIIKDGIIIRTVLRRYKLILFDEVTSFSKSKFINNTYKLGSNKVKININPQFYGKDLFSLFVLLYTNGLLTQRVLSDIR